jgi:hypothetical protein
MQLTDDVNVQSDKRKDETGGIADDRFTRLYTPIAEKINGVEPLILPSPGPYSAFPQPATGRGKRLKVETIGLGRIQCNPG